MKQLLLTLKKEPFEVMVTGEKREEFRKNSDWIRSRLFDQLGNEKEYDTIKFVNGYGNHRPYFICEYGGFMECYMEVRDRIYSNGLIVSGITKYDFVIYCGPIIETGNLQPINTKQPLKG